MITVEDLLSAKNQRIFCCATDAGSGLFLAPLIKKLRKGNTVDLIAGYHAGITFRQQDVTFLSFEQDAVTDVHAHNLLEKKKYDLVLLGTNIGMGLEKKLTLAARENKIPTLTVIDHFWHPWQRFADLEKRIYNLYLPDHIWVISPRIKETLIETQVPASKISVVVHPYLNQLKAQKKVFDKNTLKEKYGFSENQIIVYASEPPPVGESQWYSEEPSRETIRAAIRLLVKAVNHIQSERRGIILLIKQHPTEDYGFMFDEYEKLQGPYQITEGIQPLELMIMSNAVIGLTSMFLLESIALGTPATTIQPETGPILSNLSCHNDDLFFSQKTLQLYNFIHNNSKPNEQL
jgi:hypothetical protein